MGTFRVINNSTLTDTAALMRVGFFIGNYSGHLYDALYREGNQIIDITKKGQSTYLVTDKN